MRHTLAWLLLVIALSAPGMAAESPVPALSWSELLGRVKSDPGSGVACGELIQSARQILDQPIIRRAYTLAEVGQNRTWLDTRTRMLPVEVREQFAFAMSDFMAARNLAEELPLLAAAFRLTGETAFRDRVAAQLTEMAHWSPLQRPGWSLVTLRLPADGRDGNWLGTGCGVRAITDCLHLMPDDSVDASLVKKLHGLLEREIAGVVDDWKTQRPWFVRGKQNPISNQWVLPTEGLIEACLFLGVDEHREAYELGVRNMLMALNAHGSQGEFEEGFGYASFTLAAMLHAGQAMAVAGDRRVIDHPYLQHFPTWYVHHLQPGDMTINCFDAGPGYNAAERARPLLSLLVACLDSPVAKWALANQVAGPTSDVPGLIARSRLRSGALKPPPLFASYERATRVNWRSSWRDDATGVWVRGGHRLDQHDHQDRGHVNFIWRGRPILIEAGTPDYGNRLMPVEYSSGMGHNVLQLGTNLPTGPAAPGKPFALPGWQRPRAVAPISVQRLDSKGGDVTVSAESGYDHLTRWRRQVQWRTSELTVTDDVALAGGKKNFILFRWHLGTAEPVVIQGDGNRWEITWQDAKMRLKADSAISISRVQLPDNTLAGHVGTEDASNNHTCLVVQSCQPQAALRLETEVRPNRHRLP